MMTNWGLLSIMRNVLNGSVDNMSDGDLKKGMITPAWFEEQLHYNSMLLFKKKLGLPEHFNPGTPISKQAIGDSIVTDVELQPFKTSTHYITNNSLQTSYFDALQLPPLFAFPVPNGLYLKFVHNGVQMTRPIRLMKTGRFNSVLSSTIFRPNPTFPAADIYGGHLRVSPSQLGYIHFEYFKYPTSPKIVVSSTDGVTYQYSPMSVELEWNDSNKLDILHMVMMDAGFSIARQDLMGYAESKKERGI